MNAEAASIRRRSEEMSVKSKQSVSEEYKEEGSVRSLSRNIC